MLSTAMAVTADGTKHSMSDLSTQPAILREGDAGGARIWPDKVRTPGPSERRIRAQIAWSSTQGPRARCTEHATTEVGRNRSGPRALPDSTDSSSRSLPLNEDMPASRFCCLPRALRGPRRVDVQSKIMAELFESKD